ncbi:MAG: winged helix-turn-helix domain-containing protein [Plesiomonas sp.]|uniref:winged helix-turn-helix domain-containing protein n=1 Tax=Plesiomonas sp. TaxID=2486279 RepID=UPI003EE5B588
MAKTYQVRNILINTDKTLLLDTESNKEFKIGKHDFMTLLELAKNAGTVLSKEHLLETCWPGKFVAESSITQAISNIRSLIGDNGKEQKWLKTISKTGYKLDVDAVTVISSEIKLLKSSGHHNDVLTSQTLVNNSLNNPIKIDTINKTEKFTTHRHVNYDNRKITLLQIVFSLLIVLALCLIKIHHNAKLQKKASQTPPEIYTDNVLTISSDKPTLTSDLKQIIQTRIQRIKQKPSTINILMMNNSLSFFIIANDELVHNQMIMINEWSKKEDINKLINDAINKIDV